MSIAVIGSSLSFEFRWRRWALLRDTADVIAGSEGGRLAHFRSIGDALVVADLCIPAAELARDIDDLRTMLRGRALSELMIGPKTAAVIYLGIVLDKARPLTAFEVAGIAPSGDATDLAEYFGAMCDSISNVCAAPFADGCIEVIDG